MSGRMQFGEKVRASNEQLTRGQRRVADYIERNFENCAFQTSSQIGQQAGVSEATVIRLATGLGFSGFSDMQTFIRKDLVHSRIERVGQIRSGANSQTNLLEEVARLDAQNVQDTLSQLRTTDFSKAIKMILDAPVICTIGMRSSAATASYITAGLNQLFGNVMPLSFDAGDSLNRLRGMPRQTLVIGVSFLRYAKHTRDVLKHARKLKLPTLLITDSLMAPPAEYADVALVAATSSLHFLPSQIGGISLVNALIVGLVQQGNDRVVSSLRRFEELLAEINVFCERG